MAIKKSRGLAEAQASYYARAVGSKNANTLALNDNGASADTITDSGSGFLTAGFRNARYVEVLGAANASNDTGGTPYAVTTVAAGTITLASGALSATQAAGTAFSVFSMRGGSWLDIFEGGCLRIYSGSMPSSADDAETGTMLVEFSLSGTAFVADSGTGSQNGISFGAASWDSTDQQAEIDKLSGQTWQGTAAATGTAGYFVMYDKAQSTGALTGGNGIRLYGSVGVGTGDLQLSSTAITAGATETVNSLQFNFLTNNS